MNHAIQVLSRTKTWALSVVFAIIVVVVAWHLLLTPAFGASLGNRSLQLDDNTSSATSDYLLSFHLTTPGTLGSVRIQFCSDGPLINTPCTAPSGFDASAAALTAQSGASGFTISNASTANEIVLSRLPSPTGAVPVSYNFSGIKNPSSPGSYFVRLQTYSSNDASGAVSDFGGIAFVIAVGFPVTATVPPYLIFCTGITIPGFNCANASGNYLDVGELSSNKASSGTSQLLVATNATDGYNVTMQGSTLASGNNTIAALSSSDVSRPGTSQFGLNFRANAAPAVGSNPAGPGVGSPRPNYNLSNVYRFGSGETIIASPTGDDLRQYTASYIVNVPSTQAPGVYVSTITYICLASF